MRQLTITRNKIELNTDTHHKEWYASPYDVVEKTGIPPQEYIKGDGVIDVSRYWQYVDEVEPDLEYAFEELDDGWPKGFNTFINNLIERK